MLKHRHIDRICLAIVAVTVVLALLYTLAAASGWISASSFLDYEQRLFDTGSVHSIDISMTDWDAFLDTCVDEEYSACTLTIDGERYVDVAIRGKGNTSLSSVAAYGNDRYSFKVEFDHYDSNGSYYGLDKLCLNNLIQDNTYLKDYLCYTLMRQMGVAAPLCSFVYLTVNGEDWGLYLAVEGVEDAFLQRNYGSGRGELYKPDSLSMGGGRGNGGAFDLDSFLGDTENSADNSGGTDRGGRDFGGTPPDGGGLTLPEGFDTATPPEDFDSSALPEGFEFSSPPDGGGGMAFGGGGGNMGGGMGSSDVMLQYSDDDPDSYANIFDNAKTEITDADETRLIASLKALSAGEDLEDVVDVEAVIRYFVVHDFVCNGDSYTGSMVHNYYLYEENGVLSMIPWDYNLAFGGFSMGGGDSATATVNAPIDTPVSGGDLDSRPMVAWIFASEEYTALYHQYYQEFLDTCFNSGWLETTLDEVTALIAPYVEQDPTAFCTYEEFETGVAALRDFCLLRAESVAGQLDGSIPATEDGQAADDSALIDASGLSLSDMGSMGNTGGGMGGNGDHQRGDFGGRSETGSAPQNGDAAAGTPPDGTDTNTGASTAPPSAPVD